MMREGQDVALTMRSEDALIAERRLGTRGKVRLTWVSWSNPRADDS
jgi:hypothetical protein